MKKVALIVLIFGIYTSIKSEIYILPQEESFGGKMGTALGKGIGSLLGGITDGIAHQNQVALQIYIQNHAHQQRLKEIALQERLLKEEQLRKQQEATRKEKLKNHQNMIALFFLFVICIAFLFKNRKRNSHS